MKKIKGLLALGLLWFVIHQIVIVTDGLADDKGTSNYIVVFGNTVKKDGTLSARLKARLDKGKELYVAQKGQKIFVSGGLGKEGFLEGSKMGDYLVANGIPKEDIVVDDKGNNTHLTAVNFKAKFPDVQSVFLVSQFYHLTRAKLAFRQVGIKKAYGVRARYFELKDFYSLIREFVGYYKYFLVY